MSRSVSIISFTGLERTMTDIDVLWATMSYPYSLPLYDPTAKTLFETQNLVNKGIH